MGCLWMCLFGFLLFAKLVCFFLQEFAMSLIAVLILSPALLCLGGFSVSVVWGCASAVICMFWTLVLCWRSGLQGESPKIKTVKQSPIDSKGKIKRRMKKKPICIRKINKRGTGLKKAPNFFPQAESRCNSIKESHWNTEESYLLHCTITSFLQSEKIWKIQC